MPKKERDYIEEKMRLFKLMHPGEWTEEIKAEYENRFSNHLQKSLDKGYGDCWLAIEACRKILIDSLFYYNEQEYFLTDYVIMPNHVHLLGVFNTSPEKILPSVKRFSARKINELVDRKGILWDKEIWDRMIRDETHLEAVRGYIDRNPKFLPRDMYTLWHYYDGRSL